MTQNKDPIKLTTVRIMGVSLATHGANELLVVSKIVNGHDGDMAKIRIYLKDEVWNVKTLAIATAFYNHLVKYRELLRKKVRDKNLYKAYREIQALEGTNDVPFCGIGRMYIGQLKVPKRVLAKPRKGYTEVKSDTARLYLLSEIIKREKENYENIKKGDVKE